MNFTASEQEDGSGTIKDLPGEKGEENIFFIGS